MSGTIDLSLEKRPAPAGARAPARGSDAFIYLLLVLLTLGAWHISRQGYFTAGDDVGYWLGVAGGVMMLALFSYPLRKYVRVFHRWGKVKWWFLVHITLGIGGPLLILVHSTFRVGSLNAAVALYSMLIVALSGVAGRFIYLRVNRGLKGEQTSLRELQAKAGLDQSEARSRLHFAPAVEAQLLAFHELELSAKPGWPTWLRQVMVLPLEQWFVYHSCARELKAPLRKLAQQLQWTAADLKKRDRLARKLIRQYLNCVVRVAQYSAYERLFALWHVLHVPFVYILVISAVVHVIAVHAY
jgi:hypothetical protein